MAVTSPRTPAFDLTYKWQRSFASLHFVEMLNIRPRFPTFFLTALLQPTYLRRHLLGTRICTCLYRSYVCLCLIDCWCVSTCKYRSCWYLTGAARCTKALPNWINKAECLLVLALRTAFSEEDWESSQVGFVFFSLFENCIYILDWLWMEIIAILAKMIATIVPSVAYQQ